MKIKDKKTLEILSGKTDKKNRLNRSINIVDDSILKTIEKGVTIELIDEIINNHKLPVFRYHTQITIHGLFPELGCNYLYGYKNLFQNKNKSIGIKWSAIDESKRIELRKALHWLGFNYDRNSISQIFYINKYPENADEFASIVKNFKNIISKIDLSLIYGGVKIVSGNYMGRVIVILEITINAIYQKDIPIFLDNLGLTSEIVKKYEDNEKKQREKRDKEYEIERKKEYELKAEILKVGYTELIKHNMKKVLNVDHKGIFYSCFVNWKGLLKYNKILIYKIKGKRYLRFTREQFDNINDAITYKMVQNYYIDEIVKRKFKVLWRL